MTNESKWTNVPDSAVRKEEQDYPVIPSDLYNGKIVRVGEPFESTGEYGPKTKFVLDWELSGGDLAEPVELPQFITLPDKFISEGFLSDKSTLFKVMTALGFDMDGEITVRPWTWEGKEARVDVETKDVKVTNNGKTETVQRSYIQGIRPPRQRNTAAKAPARQPAAAGARKADGWDDDDDDN